MEVGNSENMLCIVQEKWMQQERCQNYCMEQLMHKNQGEAVALRYARAHDALQLGLLQQERVILRAKLVAAEANAAELLFSCNLLRSQLQYEKEFSIRAAATGTAFSFSQLRALSDEKRTAKQSAIESGEKAETLAKNLETAIQQNLKLREKFDQLASRQGRGEEAAEAVAELAKAAREAADKEYAHSLEEKNQLLARAMEEAEMLRERLGLLEAEGPVSQVVQDVVLQETESQNEDLKLQVDILRESEEKLLIKARHRDAEIEEKVRELRLVSQERDRLRDSIEESKHGNEVSASQAVQRALEGRIRELEAEAAHDHNRRQHLEDQVLSAKSELQRAVREKAEADKEHNLQEQRLRGAEETITQLQDEKAKLRQLCEDLDQKVRLSFASKLSRENAPPHPSRPGQLTEQRGEETVRGLEPPLDTQTKPSASPDSKKRTDGSQRSEEHPEPLVPMPGAEAFDSEACPEDDSQFLNMSLVTPDSVEPSQSPAHHGTQPDEVDVDDADVDDVEIDKARNRDGYVAAPGIAAAQMPYAAAEKRVADTGPFAESQMDTGSDSQGSGRGTASRAANVRVEKTLPESTSVANRGGGNEQEAAVVESESGAKGSTGRGSDLPWEKEVPRRTQTENVPVYTRRAVTRKRKEEQRAKDGREGEKGEEKEEKGEEEEASQVGGRGLNEYDFSIQMEEGPEKDGGVKSRPGRKRKGDPKEDRKENEDHAAVPHGKRRTKAEQVVQGEAADKKVDKVVEAAGKEQVCRRAPLAPPNTNIPHPPPPTLPARPSAPTQSAGSANLPMGGGLGRASTNPQLPPLPSQSKEANQKKRRLTRITPLPPSPLGQSGGRGSGWGAAGGGTRFGKPESQSSVSMFTDAFRRERRESLAQSNSGVKKSFAFSPAR